MIAEADMGLTAQAFENNQKEGDDSLYVKFQMHPRQDTRASEEAGRPIYKEVEYVQIITPGNKDNVIFRPAKPEDRVRFPRQYAVFQSGGEQESAVGTPLAIWPGINRAQVEELKYFGIHTVEQLAKMSDANAQNFMGINALKAKAAAFLEMSSQTAEAEEFSNALHERDVEINSLKEANAELIKRLDALEETAKAD